MPRTFAVFSPRLFTAPGPITILSSSRHGPGTAGFGGSSLTWTMTTARRSVFTSTARLYSGFVPPAKGNETPRSGVAFDAGEEVFLFGSPAAVELGGNRGGRLSKR
jgi:hypothetical protein